MPHMSSRVLAFIPAALVAALAVEISRLGLHHRWVSHLLVPAIWGAIFGLCAYGAFLWILRPGEDAE
jgi:hypothetical protein